MARGVFVATVFLAIVGILIDTWVASRVIELYWPLVGAAFAATPEFGHPLSRRAR